MNPYVNPMGFGRCPFGCSAGPCKRRTDFGTTYGQSCRPVWGKYRACRTHKYGRHLDHARLSTGPRSTEAHLFRKAQHAHCSPTDYTAQYGSNNHRKTIQNPQRGHPPMLIRDFAMRVIGKQGHKASSYEQRSLIKLSWSHMPFRFCHAQVHISQLLRIFITIVCLHALKQTELKLHVLRQ